ncbi:serine/threonine protein kinase, partial [Singulisphaera rosea]
MTDPDSGRETLEELAEEFAALHRRGERPTLTEYARRYPELADDILELFPALLVLEELRPAPSPTSRAGDAGWTPLRRLGEYRIVREIG